MQEVTVQSFRDSHSGISPHRSIVEEVVNLVNDPNTSVAKLSATVVRDRTLTQVVLRRANSPYYGFPREVRSVHFAISLLGFDALKETVARAIVNQAFRQMVESMYRYEDFWRHSLACGILSRALARRDGMCDPSDAFAAGLLHDVGKFALGSDSVLLRKLSVGRSLTFGNANELGALLAERWNMKPNVVDAVRWCTQPFAAAIDTNLAITVDLANKMAVQLGVGESHMESEVPSPMVEDFWRETLPFVEGAGYPWELVQVTDRRFRDFRTYVDDVKIRLIEGLGALPHHDVVLISLFYFEGLTSAEIAKFMNVSIGEVEVNLKVALNRLNVLTESPNTKEHAAA